METEDNIFFLIFHLMKHQVFIQQQHFGLVYSPTLHDLDDNNSRTIMGCIGVPDNYMLSLSLFFAYIFP